MRIKYISFAASLVAAMIVLPTVATTPASAQNWFQRTFNRYVPNRDYNNYNNYYNDYNYAYPNFSNVTYPQPYYGTGGNMNTMVTTQQISKAQHQAWVDSINARVARGELTLQEGNAILIRGFE